MLFIHSLTRFPAVYCYPLVKCVRAECCIPRAAAFHFAKGPTGFPGSRCREAARCPGRRWCASAGPMPNSPPLGGERVRGALEAGMEACLFRHDGARRQARGLGLPFIEGCAALRSQLSGKACSRRPPGRCSLARRSSRCRISNPSSSECYSISPCVPRRLAAVGRLGRESELALSLICPSVSHRSRRTSGSGEQSDEGGMKQSDYDFLFASEAVDEATAAAAAAAAADDAAAVGGSSCSSSKCSLQTPMVHGPSQPSPGHGSFAGLAVLPCSRERVGWKAAFSPQQDRKSVV